MHLSYKLIFSAAVCFDYGMVWPAARNSKIPAGQKEIIERIFSIFWYQVAQTSFFNLEHHSLAMQY